MNKAAQEFLSKTREQGLLSFGNGIKNELGARYTNKEIGLRIKNTGSNVERVIITPERLLGSALETISREANVESGVITETVTNVINSRFGLPAGTPFFKATTAVDGGNLTIATMNPEQKLGLLASAFVEEPTQVVALTMNSFTTAGVPENSNYGNNLMHYKVSHLEETKRVSTLNFQRFQNRGDFSTEIMKIDLIKEGFNAPITTKDVLVLQINPGTSMDITMQIGGRLSLPEFFHRQIDAAAKALLNNFPNESAVCSK